MKRDLVGYGKNLLRVEWPESCQIAVSLVVNYEEGSSSRRCTEIRDRDQWRNTISQTSGSAQPSDGIAVGIWRGRAFGDCCAC